MERQKYLEFERLLAEIGGDEAFTIDQIHGLITAIIIGPETVQPAEWFPYILNRESTVPPYESPEKAQRLMDLVKEFYFQTANQLASGDPFIPFLGGSGERVAPRWDPMFWCSAFLDGTKFCREAWAEHLLGEDSELNHYFAPLYYFSDPNGKSELLGEAALAKDKVKELDHAFLMKLPGAVRDIRDYWRKAKGLPPLPKSDGSRIVLKPEGAEPGRNDACPCGSGKKFKKCCGNKSLN